MREFSTQRSWANTDWVVMSSSAPRVASQLWMRDRPGVNTGIGFWLPSSAGVVPFSR